MKAKSKAPKGKAALPVESTADFKERIAAMMPEAPKQAPEERPCVRTPEDRGYYPPNVMSEAEALKCGAITEKEIAEGEALIAAIDQTWGDVIDQTWGEDKCKVCGVHLGYGITALHLGDCGAHNEMTAEAKYNTARGTAEADNRRMRSDEGHFDGSVEIWHEDKSYFRFNYASLVELDVHGEAFIVVHTEHNGAHVFFREDVARFKVGGLQ